MANKTIVMGMNESGEEKKRKKKGKKKEDRKQRERRTHRTRKPSPSLPYFIPPHPFLISSIQNTNLNVPDGAARGEERERQSIAGKRMGPSLCTIHASSVLSPW